MAKQKKKSKSDLHKTPTCSPIKFYTNEKGMEMLKEVFKEEVFRSGLKITEDGKS